MSRVMDSSFWPELWREYAKVPSVALSRVPELEYASNLSIDGAVLDHCCGDGLFASLAWPGKKLAAGCDINPESVNSARARGIYGRVDVCDVSKKLPYPDASFDVVFNNSGLEHVKDLQSTLLEIRRVLKPDGIFALNVLNARFFEWWPLGPEKKAAYCLWQPFYHALTRQEWDETFENAGMKITSCKGYFNRQAARILARLDFAFSAFYLANRKYFRVGVFLRFFPLFASFCRMRLGRTTWRVGPDEGAGFSIVAGIVNPLVGLSRKKGGD